MVVAVRDEDIKKDLNGEGRGHPRKEGEEEKREHLNTMEVEQQNRNPLPLISLHPTHSHLWKQWTIWYLVKRLPGVLQGSCPDIRCH